MTMKRTSPLVAVGVNLETCEQEHQDGFAPTTGQCTRNKRSQKQLKADRLATLEKLSAIDQEMGVGYDNLDAITSKTADPSSTK